MTYYNMVLDSQMFFSHFLCRIFVQLGWFVWISGHRSVDVVEGNLKVGYRGCSPIMGYAVSTLMEQSSSRGDGEAERLDCHSTGERLALWATPSAPQCCQDSAWEHFIVSATTSTSGPSGLISWKEIWRIPNCLFNSRELSSQWSRGMGIHGILRSLCMLSKCSRLRSRPPISSRMILGRSRLLVVDLTID